MARRYWFKPKTHGYGATPATWEGWALTIAGIAVILGAGWWFIGSDANPAAPRVLTWALVVVVTVVVLTAVSYVKTDGAWRWRWGSSSDLR